MSRLGTRLALALLLLFLAAPGRSQAPEQAPEQAPAPAPAEGSLPEETGAGPVVTAVELRSEVELEDPDELARLLSVTVGEPLTPEAMRSTLRNLQASGVVSSTELYTREEGEGVVVIVVLRPVMRVGEVRLEGELGLPQGDLRNALPQKEAEPLNEERVVQGVYQLQNLYSERGYFNASVRVRVESDEASQRSAVVYTLQSGPRWRIATVAFDGPLGRFTPEELIRRLAVKPGEPFSQREVREDADRLQAWLVEQGYRTARVDPPERQVDPAAQSVALRFPIDVGPQVHVNVIGADVDRLRRRDLLPFLGPQGYDEALVLQATQRLKNWYQGEGHYKVRVESEERRTEDRLDVTLRIEPGPEYTLKSLEFTGNETFGADELEERVTTSQRSLLNLGSGHLVDSVLAEDLRNIRNFYALQGFPGAEVGPARIEESGRELAVSIPIREGARQRVVNLEFESFEDLDPGSVSLLLTEGGPFHPFLLERSLEALRAEYQRRGYAAAQVSAREDWNAEHTLVDVTFEAFEGPQVVLDRVIVRGNRRTESDVIRRTLGIDRGDPISEARRLEIQRDLYRLGIFSSVDVELARAGIESASRDLIVRVEEGRPRRVSYGLGFEYSLEDSLDDEDAWDPRGSFSFSHNNVAGKAFSLRTDLRVGRDQVARLVFDQPHVGRYAVPVTYSLFYFNEVRERWDVERYGARVEAVRNFADRRVSLAYDYRIADNQPRDGTMERDVDREDRSHRLSSLVPSFLWDRRNDPLLATRGWSALAQLQYAFPAFGTDGDFLKLFLQQTQYLDLRNFGVVAASLRAGGIEPFAELPGTDPEVPEGEPNADVFIDERFFAGGPTTHRAYGRDDLGILGRTRRELPANKKGVVPVAGFGGNGLLLFNLEYRFPLFGALGGTVFYDAGNVWPDWREIDPGEVRHGAGVGLRYNSPIGPIRFDIGWKLNREIDRGEERERAYSYSILFGNPF